MSPTLVAIVGAIYVYVAVCEARVGHSGVSLMFIGYALANVGIILNMRGL